MKIGDRVTLDPQSQWANHGEFGYNPVNIRGTVVEVEGDEFLPLTVEWDNTRRNNYDDIDLLAVDHD